MLSVKSVTITLGFAKAPETLVQFYRKGQGMNLKESLQSMITKKFNYMKDDEKLALLEFINEIKNMDLNFLSPKKVVLGKRSKEVK